MIELTDEIMTKVKASYTSFSNLLDEKKELTAHNRTMKADFMDIEFEDLEGDEKGTIKKEITKYFNSIDEVGSGSDPVVEVKSLRKNHLDLDDEVYERLMSIFKMIHSNNDAKEKLDLRIKNTVVEIALEMKESFDVVKGIFDEFRKRDDGKTSNLIQIAKGYETLASKV